MEIAKNNKIWDIDNPVGIAIIGAGPAGLTAAIYALRDNKSVLLFEKNEVGGQIINSTKVTNIPGFKEISGYDFIENLKEQIMSINSGIIGLVEEEVIDVDKDNKNKSIIFKIKTNTAEYYAKSVIVATGSTYKTLNVKGEKELIGNGISFCSTCDAPFYKDKVVAVIGGGNSALTEAIELSSFAKKVIIIQDLEDLTAEQSLIDKMCSLKNIDYRTGALVEEFRKTQDGKISVYYYQWMAEYGENCLFHEDFDGVFIAIGMQPQNQCVSDITELSKDGYILCGHYMIECAGDCKKKTTRQVVTACGDGAEAAIKICRKLNK